MKGEWGGGGGGKGGKQGQNFARKLTYSVFSKEFDLTYRKSKAMQVFWY